MMTHIVCIVVLDFFAWRRVQYYCSVYLFLDYRNAAIDREERCGKSLLQSSPIESII